VAPWQPGCLISAGSLDEEGLVKKEERQILIFRVASEELGLDISCVREVLRPQETFSLPNTPAFVEGVINLRGHIIPLIDLRKRLHPGQAEEEPNKRIIICRVNRFIVGLTVNSLREIAALSQDDIEPTPEVISMQTEREVTSRIARVGKRIVPILDLDRILTRKEVTQLTTLEL
jgi:purine-binding chemotaxis protein CheW